VANAALPEGILMTLLAALLLVTGVDALLRGPVVEQVRRLGVPNQLTVGALVGFGFRSRALAVPVLLVPILLLLWAPVLAAQAVALPVVAFSTAGYVHYGSWISSLVRSR
jgi:hypothetical protein